MSQAEQTISMRYFGLSIGEIEILFNMLRDPFEVNEQKETSPDEDLISFVDLDFPLAYDKKFFKVFGMEKWERIKEVLKNMKWRRGKKGIRLSMRFNSKPSISFVIHTDNNKIFGKALDTIEYLMDVILLQIDPQRLPANVVEVRYEFDENEYRWYPSKAMGDKEYTFVNDKWIER